MSRAGPVRVERAPRRRGAFGLDDPRRPDPARVEAEIRGFLRERLPEVWPLEPPAETAPAGRTVVLLLPRGHAAVLRIEPDAAAPSLGALALVAQCRERGIPSAVVESLAQARAALRRFGVEPRPDPLPIFFRGSLGRCRARSSP